MTVENELDRMKRRGRSADEGRDLGDSDPDLPIALMLMAIVYLLMEGAIVAAVISNKPVEDWVFLALSASMAVLIWRMPGASVLSLAVMLGWAVIDGWYAVAPYFPLEAGQLDPVYDGLDQWLYPAAFPYLHSVLVFGTALWALASRILKSNREAG